jgi:outer membrane protein TolC
VAPTKGAVAIALVVLAGLALSTTSVSAQDADTLRLTDVIAAVRSTNPTLQAARYRTDAAQERVRPAGTLPDPVLSLGLMNRPVDDLGRTDVQMTMNVIQLTQTLPWPGSLGYDEERLAHLATADSLDTEELEAALVSRVTAVYVRLASLDRAIEIMETTRDLLRDFRQVSEARYAVGEGIQQDILQAQVSVARMTADITVAAQDRLAAAARLNGLMGRPATLDVPALELPTPGGELPGVDQLMEEAALQRPAFAAARQRALAAGAAYRQAERDAYPDFTVSLGYGQRPEFVDLATLMVGVSLPVFGGSKQSRVKEERRAVQSMEVARELDLHNETYARLAELRAQAERARSLSDLYRTSILPQARAGVEAALSAYQVGNVDYMTLLTNQMTVNQFEVERVRLAAEYHEAAAAIASLTGSNGIGIP